MGLALIVFFALISVVVVGDAAWSNDFAAENATAAAFCLLLAYV